ncbi:MAG: glycosyltransferase [Actinobacteria bacterium]|nr:glycosyltransferase [Actinomycetota bacterium]
MRVLVVTSMYPTPAQPELGGFVRDQVEALRAAGGVDVEVFAIEPDGTGRWLRAALALRRAYAADSFDVVHAHHGLAGWSAMALRAAPHIVTFHGTDVAHPVVGRMSRILARLIALPAPVSASLARTLLARRPGARALRAGRRVAVLPVGVNLTRFGRRDRAESRDRLGLEPSGRYLLFPAAATRPEKRHDRAQALADAANARLLTYDGLRPDRVPDAVNAVNAVVATSEREGFGLAPLEALACDVPVLATDVGVAPLALRGVAGTLCAPFDIESWRDALRPHLDDPDPRIRGRERAELFSTDRMAARVLQAYRDLKAANDPPDGRNW